MHRPERWRTLDGVRAIAILLVIPHNADIYPADPGSLWPLAMIASLGWIGVQLFFVLSGFLITGQLLDATGSPHYFRDFYLRRALRILPLYYLTLVVGLILLPALSSAPSLASSEHTGQVWLWLFLIKWVQPFGQTIHGFEHFWSLAVEEQYYLAWPFVVLVYRESGLLRACFAAVALAVVTRTALLLSGTPHEANYMFTVCRMDALALGAIAALLVRRPATAERIADRGNLVLLLAALGLGLLALATHVYSTSDPLMQILGYSLLAVGFAAGILVLAAREQTERGTWLERVLAIAPLRAVGRYSYAMYVFHLPLVIALTPAIRRWFAGTGQALPLIVALLVGIATFVAGAISYHVFEKHLLALKTRVAPRVAYRS